MEAVAFSKMMIEERAESSVADLRACAQVRAVDLAFGGQKVLAGVNCDLRPGELVILRGENGSGKTALLNVLSGYLAPDCGSVRLQLGGVWTEITGVSPEFLARRGVGRLWQDIRLFPSMTVLDNVLAGTARMLGANPVFALLARPAALRQERRARGRALQNLALVGMADRAQSSCDMLSVGQMKRVALARLLQMEASLLLLDEPFAGLDAAAVSSLALDLERLRTERGKTILMVEHRRDVVAHIADRVWTMKDGRIEESEGSRA
jgi:ABC-type branched-subunit amino acid transport system ATPase component